jgi:hypothetical protein
LIRLNGTAACPILEVVRKPVYSSGELMPMLSNRSYIHGHFAVPLIMAIRRNLFARFSCRGLRLPIVFERCGRCVSSFRIIIMYAFPIPFFRFFSNKGWHGFGRPEKPRLHVIQAKLPVYL